MFVVLDLDQTLADNTHRQHLVEKDPKNWDAFFAPDLVIKDALIAGAERVLTHFEELKYDFVILTGRNEDLRDTTMRWLQENLNIKILDEHLLMRPNGNMLNAGEYKREQLLNFKQGLESKNVDFLIIDDDVSMGSALKDFGVVLQAPECWSLLFPVPKPEKEAAE
jgi:predicted secreted acid phosphatase